MAFQGRSAIKRAGAVALDSWSRSPHATSSFRATVRRELAGAVARRPFSSGIPSNVGSKALLPNLSPSSISFATLAPRRVSTLPPFQLGRLYPERQVHTALSQRRTIFGSGSQNLSHMEQTANNNPTSPSAQNAFYAALLRANLPVIVVERYQTGRYATNPACEATYHRALEKLGQSARAVGMGVNQVQGQGQNQALSNQDLQTIGQAIAAHSRGGTAGMATGQNGAVGTGAKNSPLYVVVDESRGAMALRWFKFIFWFVLTGYVFFVLFQLAIEFSGIFKRVGGNPKNEAQAQQQKTRFSDVHGCDEAKEELQELVDFLKNPERFSTLGGKLPKGVLLVGPPGTGKTLLARAVAGESGVPFFFMSGSEFDEMYVGVGAKRIRELFSSARAKAPAIIFIDELDAVGGKRNERDAAYSRQTLNQLLTELDGFSQETGIIIMGATNFPQLLDKALTRPGRFDRHVVVPLPDVRGRMQILKHHMKNVRIAADVDTSSIARSTTGFSGADLENLINQAAVNASKNKEKEVGMLDFEWAKDKITMGAERRSAVIKPEDKIMTAYHEGGHALVALFTEGASPLHKVTIMPRGQTLGITYFLPEMDQVSMSYKQYLAQISVAMGGKVAEELIYGAENVGSGSSSDIQGATRIAYAMVTEMGFSDLLGDVDLVTNYSGLSSETKQKIEREVQRIVDEARQRAKAILTEKRKELDLVAKALVEYEILSSEEMAKILKGEKLAKMTASPNTPIKLPELPFPPSIGRPVSPSIPGVGPLPGSDAGSGVGPLSGGKPPTTGGDGGVDA